MFLSSHLKTLPKPESLRHLKILPETPAPRAAVFPLASPLAGLVIVAPEPTVCAGFLTVGCPEAWEGRGARLVRHAIQPIELLVDPLREGERIGLRQHPAQGRDFLRIGLRARTHPLKRRLRSVIATDQSGTLPDFCQEFHRRLEQVLEQPQVGIQRVEGLQRLRTVLAIPADELAHMGPVLLLHMSVIIFFIGA